MAQEKQNPDLETQTTVRGRFLIRNRLGLHARAAAVLVQTANRYSSNVMISKNDVEVSGKSIMSVLQLAAVQGEYVDVIGRGADAEQAVQAIGELIEQFFGEEE